MVTRRAKIKKISDSYKETQENSKPVVSSRIIDPNKLVPTGSVPFNLECSGNYKGAFSIGKMVNIIGDSHAGKTLFALTIFAECSLLPRFDKYRFIYDDVETANEFDIPYLFGQKVADRIEMPGSDLTESGLLRSDTIEIFNDNLARANKRGEPYIYILDSFDAMTSEAAMEKDEENRKSREKGNQISGSYGDGKPRKASELFSQRIKELSKNDSVLIIISQTRDNIGFGAKFTPKTRSGGRALKFYAFHEIWLACQNKEKAGKRTLLTNVQAKITKNKLTGRHGEVIFPILFDYGVDNIASCIRFLVEEGDWSGTKAALNTQGFIPKKVNSSKKEVFRSYKEVVNYIEENGLEEELFGICQKTYDGIIEKLRPKRKRKY